MKNRIKKVIENSFKPNSHFNIRNEYYINNKGQKHAFSITDHYWGISWGGSYLNDEQTGVWIEYRDNNKTSIETRKNTKSNGIKIEFQ